MRYVCRLHLDCEAAPTPAARAELLAAWCAAAPAPDARWLRRLANGFRLQLGITPRHLRQWAADLSGHPDWMVDACNQLADDLSDTFALLLPNPAPSPPELPFHQLIEDHLLPLAGWDPPFQFHLLRPLWPQLDTTSAFLVAKLITGSFPIRR
jgi:DNA ligase 1